MILCFYSGIGDVYVAVVRDALRQWIYGKAISNMELALHYLTRWEAFTITLALMMGNSVTKYNLYQFNLFVVKYLQEPVSNSDHISHSSPEYSREVMSVQC
mgnify:CR=1 FL=1